MSSMQPQQQQQPQQQIDIILNLTYAMIKQCWSNIQSTKKLLHEMKMKMDKYGCPNLDSFEERSKLSLENYLLYEDIFNKWKRLKGKLKEEQEKLIELCQEVPVDESEEGESEEGESEEGESEEGESEEEESEDESEDEAIEA